MSTGIYDESSYYELQRISKLLNKILEELVKINSTKDPDIQNTKEIISTGFIQQLNKY